MSSKKIKKLYIDFAEQEQNFISKIISKKSVKEEFKTEDIELLRKIFSNEKSRILYFLKRKKPKSIYALAKLLQRDFKSVYQDLKTLERFGIIEFYSEKKGDRESLKPVLLVDEVQFFLKL